MISFHHKNLAAILLCSSISCVSLADNSINQCVIEAFAAEESVRQFQYDSFSFDGNFIAVGWDKGESDKGTYLLNLVTGGHTDVPGFNNGASFSPDAKFLIGAVYMENGKTDIVEYEIATQETSVLAQHEQWDWLPSYSPDGKSVLFNSYRTGNSDLYLLDLTSRNLRQLTKNDEYEAHGQFSPDGSKVLYHKNDGDGDFNIYVLELSSGKTTQLTDSPREESYGSWSPDGKHIVFASDRDQEAGVNDIFIMSSNGKLLQQINNDSTKDGYPFWSPDGQYIYFNSSRKPEGIYRVKMDNMIDCASS